MAEIQSAPKQSINIKIKIQSEEICRTLEDRVCIKIGRQVKSPQEKLLMIANSELAQEQNSLASPVPIEVQEGDHNGTVRGRELDATVFQNSLTPETTPTKNEVPSVVDEGSKGSPIWFKSKVVSRSHAEIWYKDGHVLATNFRYI
jgi:pSer/pThr/pTyr-binding forkhead associated (FHA) protein